MLNLSTKHTELGFKEVQNQNEKLEAETIWSLVMDVSKINGLKVGITQGQFNQIMRETNMQDFGNKTPRQEVLVTARFIANLDPSYRNSQGQPVSLSYLRSELSFTKEDLDYIIDRLEEVVKPFISVSTETVMTGLKLKVATSMPKKRLIKAAFMHLLLGSEVVGIPEQYANIKEAAVLAGTPKISYAYLIGAADKLLYPSVPAMMEDLVLTFIDQTENIRRDGKLVFYDGSVRVERM